MKLVIDPDIRSVAEFMQRSLPAAKLVGVAEGICTLAPILWGRYNREQVVTLSLHEPSPISASVMAGDSDKLRAATEAGALEQP